jgi:hypothetical protein
MQFPEINDLDNFSYLRDFLKFDAFSDSNQDTSILHALDNSIMPLDHPLFEFTPSSGSAVETEPLHLLSRELAPNSNELNVPRTGISRQDDWRANTVNMTSANTRLVPDKSRLANTTQSL